MWDERFHLESACARIAQQAHRLVHKHGIQDDSCCAYVVLCRNNTLRFVAWYPQGIHDPPDIDSYYPFTHNLDIKGEGKFKVVSSMKERGIRVRALARAITEKRPLEEPYDEFDPGFDRLVKGAAVQLTVPIVLEARVLGAICVQHQNGSFFWDQDIENLLFLSTHAAYVIEMARLLRIRFGLRSLMMPHLVEGHNLKHIRYVRQLAERLVECVQQGDNQDVHEILESLRAETNELPYSIEENLTRPLVKGQIANDVPSLPTLIQDLVQNDEICKGTEWELEFEGEHTARCDPDWLRYAVRNILINAATRTNQLTRFGIQTRPPRVKTWGEKNQVFLSIENDCLTVESHVLFNMYNHEIFSTDGNEIHWGAFITAEIIDHYGGTVKVQTSPLSDNVSHIIVSISLLVLELDNM